MGGIALFTGPYYLGHVFLHRPPCILVTCQIDGGVSALHVAHGGLDHFLPAGHESYYVADVGGVNVRYVLQGLLSLPDDFS